MDIAMSEFIELGRLCLQFGRVKRATYHEDGVTKESDTDHTVMLGMVACAFAARYAPHLNIGLVSQFATVHDFVEVYSGDTMTLNIGASAADDKARREKQALDEIVGQFSHTLPWLTDTITKYECLSTPEARFVRVLDKVLPKITHALNNGQTLREHGVAHNQIADVHQHQRTQIVNSYGYDQPEAMEMLRLVHVELMNRIDSY